MPHCDSGVQVIRDVLAIGFNEIDATLRMNSNPNRYYEILPDASAIWKVG